MTTKIYQCEKCNLVFETYKSFWDHIHRKTSCIKKYDCEICGTEFPDYKSHWKHTNRKTCCLSKEQCLELITKKDEFKRLEEENKRLRKDINELEQKDYSEQEHRAFKFTKYLMNVNPSLLTDFAEIFKEKGVNHKSLKEFASKLNSIPRYVPEKVKKNVSFCQEYKCKLCCSILPPSYEIDHIIPLYLGGSNTESNLQALCPTCHNDKTVQDFSDFYFDVSALYENAY